MLTASCAHVVLTCAINLMAEVPGCKRKRLEYVAENIAHHGLNNQ